jgi:sugar phosphate isomerase/epimerase
MIQIGAVIFNTEINDANLKTLKELGIESVSVSIWDNCLDDCRIENQARVLRDSGLRIEALSLFGNPLGDRPQDELTRRAWKKHIDRAPEFGASYVTGFAGRVPGKSVEQSLNAYREVFSPLFDAAGKQGLKGILFENCRMGDVWKRGNWNIAINPDAWELMLQTLETPLFGLEWEPCHQLEALIDPIAQLKEWIPLIKHVHGKDTKIDRALLSSNGLYGIRKPYTSELPGQGDTDWAEVFSILGKNEYMGTIDIESRGEPFLQEEMMVEKKESLSYLRRCRALQIS